MGEFSGTIQEWTRSTTDYVLRGMIEDALADRPPDPLLMDFVCRTRDEHLVNLVAHALAADRTERHELRVWHGSKWSPTPEERAYDRPYIVVPADIPRDQLPGESPEEHRNRLLREATVQHLPGVHLEVVGPQDRRDTLSREEIRRCRLDKWDRVWSHLAGVWTPIMGWRGDPEGTLYVFLLSADPHTQERWRLVWRKYGGRPERALRAGGGMDLIFFATPPMGFGMARIEPGTPRSKWLVGLGTWRANGVSSIACEIRRSRYEKRLWRATAPAGERESLMEEAAARVADLLLRRPKERVEAFPTQLACWLRFNGRGQLEPSRIDDVAAQVDPDRKGDRLRWVRDNVKAAQGQIDRRVKS